jgi:hypothetical protein
MNGPLGEGVLPGVLRELYVGRRTGLLHFTRNAHRASVCFIHGHILWGDTTDPEAYLGAVLARHGLVAQEALDQAFDLVGGGRRLGQVLVELGGLDRKTLDDALALHVREILLMVFAWQDGSYRFEEHPPEHFAGYDRALPISTGELILDAVWSVPDPDVVRYALGNLHRVAQLSTDPLLRFQRLTLTPIDGYLLSRLDGVATAREVLAHAPVERDEAERSLFGLLCTGMVEWVPAAPSVEVAAPAQEETPERQAILDAYRGIGSRSHFEVLGIGRRASEAEVKAGWVRQARRFHPDAHHSPSLGDLRGQLEAVFVRLTEAYRVLSDPRKRAEYEALLGPAPPEAQPEAEAAAPGAAADAIVTFDPLKVEELLAAAEREYEQGRYWDALQAIEPVLEGLSGRTLLRARLLRARVYSRNPKWRKDAEQELMEVTRADPANAEAYFLLGTLYKEAGVASRATAMFRKVLALKPRHAGALAELGGAPGAEGPGGLLKRLLR